MTKLSNSPPKILIAFSRQSFRKAFKLLFYEAKNRLKQRDIISNGSPSTFKFVIHFYDAIWCNGKEAINYFNVAKMIWEKCFNAEQIAQKNQD